MAQVRSPPPFRSPSSTKARPASPVTTGPSRINFELSKSSKAKRVKDCDRSFIRKEIVSENVRDRARFLFPYFSSTQEGGRLKTGDRLVGSEQLSSPGYIRDGHVSQGKISGSSRHVGDNRWTCPTPTIMSPSEKTVVDSCVFKYETLGTCILSSRSV